ncbi:MAG: hypothetical protein OXG05_08275 [Gammaproteobacteria bacterium]|nr:hypothetical protein [Gammaproteobacteria bacterium]
MALYGVGEAFGPISLAIDAGETVFINTDDLERDNTEETIP